MLAPRKRTCIPWISAQRLAARSGHCAPEPDRGIRARQSKNTENLRGHAPIDLVELLLASRFHPCYKRTIIGVPMRTDGILMLLPAFIDNSNNSPCRPRTPTHPPNWVGRGQPRYQQTIETEEVKP